MKKPALIIPLVLFGIVARCSAQQHKVKPEAQAAFDQGSKLPLGDAAELALYRKALDLDPDFPQAQQMYILAYVYGVQPHSGTDAEKAAARKKAQSDLAQSYEKSVKEHPKDAVYPWALGIMNEYEDPPRSVEYYKQAIAVDPNFGPAYDSLAITAEAQGKLDESSAYAKKAYEAWPDSVSIWRHYVGSFTVAGKNSELESVKNTILQGASKFPEEAVHMLGYVGGRSTDPEQARSIYELILQRFPRRIGGYTLLPLFNLDIKSDPQSAAQLADTVLKTVGESGSKDDIAETTKVWTPLSNYAKALVKARTQIAAGDSAAALATLDHVGTLARPVDKTPLKLASTSALDAMGQTAKAYADLTTFVATTPSKAAYTDLLRYASKLSKDKNQVDADVVTARLNASKPGKPFQLTDYATGKPVSLSDYKGHVVLVNFWYPECGPCRGEFPYLQMALDKYKDRGFVILAINGHSPEDEWVMPLIRGWGLGFTPLKGTEETMKDYGVKGFPGNFLYGADGRIYPMPSSVRPDSLEQFELQIEGLLMQAKEPPVKQQSSTRVTLQQLNVERGQ